MKATHEWNMTSEQYEIINIFLASPGDVVEERQTVRRVVEEENTNHFRHEGYEVKVVGWETDSTPGKAKKHPQELINPLIDGCALFIGVLWTRFGSPTADYESGTEEEYHHALKLLDTPELTLCDIQIYFCNYPIPPFGTDLDQLAKVANFKEEVGKKHKVYHWTVDNKEQFEQDYRRNLTSWIREYIGRGGIKRLSLEPSGMKRRSEKELITRFGTMKKGF